MQKGKENRRKCGYLLLISVQDLVDKIWNENNV